MHRLILVAFLLLAACNDFVPREKVASLDEQTGEIILPHPCPDWSQNATINYDNSLHSNYGCAVNSNLAVQLENPGDLTQGYASPHGPDMEMGVRTLQRYRAGEIPAALTPMQDSTAP